MNRLKFFCFFCLLQFCFHVELLVFKPDVIVFEFVDLSLQVETLFVELLSLKHRILLLLRSLLFPLKGNCILWSLNKSPSHVEVFMRLVTV